MVFKKSFYRQVRYQILFNISANFKYYFLISHLLQSKIQSFSFSIIAFYICACFRKYYLQCLNFIVIIQVTNKVLILSQYVYLLKSLIKSILKSRTTDFFFFNLKIFKISLPISICDNNFLCFIMFRFFNQIDILH